MTTRTKKIEGAAIASLAEPSTPDIHTIINQAVCTAVAAFKAELTAILDAKLNEFTLKLTEHSQKLLDHNQTLTEHSQKLNELNQKIVDQSSAILVLKQENYELKQRVGGFESYSKRDNLIITGVPLGSYAEAASQIQTEVKSLDLTKAASPTSAQTEAAVLHLFNNQLGLDITSRDISVAHRLKAKPGDARNVPIIVKFTSRKAREAVYGAKKRLKGCSDKIFINEDLSRDVSRLFGQAQKLVKEKRLFGAWTTGGTLYVKTSSDPNCKPTKIQSENDLPLW